MNAFNKLQFSKDSIGAMLLKIDSDDVTVVVIPSPRPVLRIDAWALTSFAGTGPGARSERHVLLSSS